MQGYYKEMDYIYKEMSETDDKKKEVEQIKLKYMNKKMSEEEPDKRASIAEVLSEQASFRVMKFSPQKVQNPKQTLGIPTVECEVSSLLALVKDFLTLNFNSE